MASLGLLKEASDVGPQCQKWGTGWERFLEGSFLMISSLLHSLRVSLVSQERR